AAAPAKPAPPRPAITVIPASKFKVPNNADYLRTVQKARPRLIHAAAGWTYVKNAATSDPTATKLLENIKKSGEAVLEAPELVRIFGEQRGTVTPGSRAIFRMATLGTLHFVEGDPRWKERGARELIAITDPATFQNWYVDEPEVTADFLIAASLGYDWFRDGLNAQQATAARTYMIEKGIGALVAHIKGEPVPDTAKGQAAGTTSAPKAKAPAKGAPKKAEGDEEPDAEHMAMASALLLAGICLIDEDPSAAKQAVDAAGKVFGKGMLRFAPAGIWPEGMEKGERVLDYAIMVMQTLKSNAGNDFGFSFLEGLPQAGVARLHLVGPTNQLFNYGDSAGATLSRPWVSTWLASAHGNIGTKAIGPGGAQNADTAFFGNSGNLMYFNPHAAGDGTPDSLDYVAPGSAIAAMRSAWNDPSAYYVAVKGGDNEVPTAQLDLGSFVLDAGGQRWAIELGSETDRAPGFESPDRTKRYALYIEGTLGQNTLLIGDNQKPDEKGMIVGGNQEFDAKGAVLAGHSSPPLGIGVVDISKAYSKNAKDVHRGAMVVRGATPYVLLQDDLLVKNSSPVTWQMFTKAEVSVAGNKVTLTQGKQTLTGIILSPAGATFSTAEPPEPANEQMKKLPGVHILKISLAEAKGPQSIAVAFALGAEPPAATHKPIAEWIPKK
ncbi:MAG TPA: hypothetical protein VD994_10345, partial [Prosthecobacter sp.]|nr:hypothetical protein [Prosthecobacter sp.]